MQELLWLDGLTRKESPSSLIRSFNRRDVLLLPLHPPGATGTKQGKEGYTN